jgi:hypothetical protein
MPVVSDWFHGGAPGPCAASELEATWSTNQGERRFADDEMRESFGVVDGHRLPLVEAEGKSVAVLSLEVKQSGFAWWLMRLGKEDGRFSDESAWVRNGSLELVVSGAAGGEQVRVGLLDGQTNPEMVLLPLARSGAVTTSWQALRVSLRALRAENPRFDWKHVKAIVIASANGKPLKLLISDARIVHPANN